LVAFLDNEMFGLVSVFLIATLSGEPRLDSSELDRRRADAAEASRRLSELRTEETAARQQLEALAAEIAQTKAQAKAKLLPARELPELLRNSQQLSSRVTELTGKIASQEAELQRRNGQLLDALSQQISRSRQDWEASRTPEEKEALLRTMRSLRAEQEQVRAMLRPRSAPSFAGTPTSDVPEDLLEQADAARDAEDKVKRQLASVDARIADAREQRDLERRMGEFLSDQSLLDQRDLRLRGSGSTDSASHNVGQRPGSDNPSSPTGQPSQSGGSSVWSDAVRRDPTSLQNQAASQGEEPLEALLRERRRLEALAGQLELQAKDLEERARALK